MTITIACVLFFADSKNIKNDVTWSYCESTQSLRMKMVLLSSGQEKTTSLIALFEYQDHI
jgi:hypothetical protein